MSEKTHPTVSRIVRTAVFAAGIAIAVYATDLIVKQYQKHKAEERRRQAQSLLAQTVAELKKRLPPPPNLRIWRTKCRRISACICVGRYCTIRV